MKFNLQSTFPCKHEWFKWTMTDMAESFSQASVKTSLIKERKHQGEENEGTTRPVQQWYCMAKKANPQRPQPMDSPMLSSCSLRGAVLLVTQTAEIPLILFQFMHFHPEAGRVREWFCGDASWGNQNLIYQSLPLKHLSEDFPSYFKKWSYGIPEAFPLPLKNHYRHVIPQVKTVMTKL